MHPPSFCVLGAGITGLSSAFCLANKYPKCRVTVVYKECSPDTTSNHGFGICSLRGLDDEFDSPDTPRFTRATARRCADLLHQSPQQAAEIGLRAVPAYLTYDRKRGSPDDADFLGGPVKDTFAYFSKVTDEEPKTIGLNEEGLKHIFEREDIEIRDVDVYKAGSWVIDNHYYLPWLKKELELMEARGDISGVNFIQREIYDFSELYEIEEFDFIVNCSGLGAEYLVPDNNMVPIRGQYLLVEPIGDAALRYGGHTFICAKSGRVALGSVYQKGRRDTRLNQFDKEDILRRCCALDPRIKDSKIISENVGVRPARYGGPRVELEMWETTSKRVSGPIPIIHNYGHGSKGILQHWGCALEVVALAEKLDNKSKL